MSGLRAAVEDLDLERSRAELRGDYAIAGRLADLVAKVDEVDEYLALGGWWSWRRTHPRGVDDRTVGWWLANDPAVRATREHYGLTVPAPVEAVAA